jgi:hypothetical protein
VNNKELVNQQSLELISEHTAPFNPQNHKISKNPEPFNIREYHGFFWCLICLKMCHAPPSAQSRVARRVPPCPAAIRPVPRRPPRTALTALPRRHPLSPASPPAYRPAPAASLPSQSDASPPPADPPHLPLHDLTNPVRDVYIIWQTPILLRL